MSQTASQFFFVKDQAGATRETNHLTIPYSYCYSCIAVLVKLTGSRQPVEKSEFCALLWFLEFSLSEQDWSRPRGRAGCAI